MGVEMTRFHWCLSIFCFALANLLFPQPGRATVINFDNLSDGVSVTTQYSSEGVTFSDPEGDVTRGGALLDLSGYSPPNVLFAYQLGSQSSPTDAGDLRVDFSVPITSVSFNAFLSEDYTFTALAYSSDGTLLNSLVTPPASSYGPANPETISASSPIAYLLLTSNADFLTNFYGNFSIDDVTFNAAAASTPLPPTLALFAAGLSMIALLRRRQRGGRVD
jgi:hypothetical protein